MTRVSVSEFRHHLHRYLKLVAEGEQVALTKRGAVVAVLTAPEAARDAAAAQLAKLRETAVVGDVESPVDVEWEADGAGS